MPQPLTDTLRVTITSANRTDMTSRKMTLTPQIIRPLLLEFLAANPEGQVHTAVEGVGQLAVARELIRRDTFGQYERSLLCDHVQMIMWQLLPQGILVWGLGGNMSNNDKYPFYRVTEHGKSALADVNKPQPYDPDGFLLEFRRLVPCADPILLDYVTEAVRAFNAACYKSAAVMLGAASEKAVLVLCNRFEDAISEPEAKNKFMKDSSGISISRKFSALKNRLDLMVDAKRFSTHHEIVDTVQHALPAVFELIRRCRNDAGHPDIPSFTDPDTVFLNLRVFTEHARRIYGILSYLDANKVSW